MSTALVSDDILYRAIAENDVDMTASLLRHSTFDATNALVKFSHADHIRISAALVALANERTDVYRVLEAAKDVGNDDAVRGSLRIFAYVEILKRRLPMPA